MSKEDSKKIRDLREENEELRSNISAMKHEIKDKNNKMAQLDNMNTRLATHNNHLTELCTKGKLFDDKVESEDEELGEQTEGRRPTEEYNGQERKQKIKCIWHEKGGCNREEYKFRHPNKVCKSFTQD